MQNQIDLTDLSRREFLKLSGASMVALFALASPKIVHASSLFHQENSVSMGRIVTNNVKGYSAPALDSKEVKTYYKDLVLPITEVAIGSGEPTYNQVWYKINDEGYVHSGFVQPVRIDLNPIVSTIPIGGQLAEITVPYSDAVWNPIYKNLVAYRLYYSTTHWVIGTLKDETGQVWYEILEDFYEFHYFVNATHLRLISPDEVTTLSPDVPLSEKHIRVHLNEQTVVAYEGDTAVQMIRCSGGTKLFNIYLTPTGDFTTDYKRPSRHMVNGSKAAANTYDLPGVPWVSFINDEGISFHGTYWHNDFGRPRSHGCINLPSEGSKWLYRWTLPEVPFAEQKFYKRPGTSVTVTKG
ncbi:MAG: L,D-transpeptidase family protein [Anaerolineaceae bacterium]